MSKILFNASVNEEPLRCYEWFNGKIKKQTRKCTISYAEMNMLINIKLSSWASGDSVCVCTRQNLFPWKNSFALLSVFYNSVSCKMA